MAGVEVSTVRAARANGTDGRHGALRELLVTAAESARRVRRVEGALHAGEERRRHSVRERVTLLLNTIESREPPRE